MSSLPTPKLADLDDPLAPRPEPPAPPTPAPSTAPRTPAKRTPRPKPVPATTSRSLADQELVAVFGRLPESLSDRLTDGVRAINAGRPRRSRVSQQDVLGALVDRHVTPEQPDELGELVDAYRQRLRA